MSPPNPTPSARKRELLELAYHYVLVHGIGELSLRPLAKAIGSSPRVLLYLFGTKDGLTRALLQRARSDELTMLERLRHATTGTAPLGLGEASAQIWRWLAVPDHRGLLILWVEAYAHSLTDPDGPWTHFARTTVEDWLALLAQAQPVAQRDTAVGISQRTLVLATLRGALLDLLATGDTERTTTAVERYLTAGVSR